MLFSLLNKTNFKVRQVHRIILITVCRPHIILDVKYSLIDIHQAGPDIHQAGPYKVMQYTFLSFGNMHAGLRCYVIFVFH